MTQKEIIKQTIEKLKCIEWICDHCPACGHNKAQGHYLGCYMAEALTFLDQFQDQEASDGMERMGFEKADPPSTGTVQCYYHSSDCTPNPFQNDCKCGLLQRVRGDKAERIEKVKKYIPQDSTLPPWLMHFLEQTELPAGDRVPEIKVETSDPIIRALIQGMRKRLGAQQQEIERLTKKDCGIICIYCGQVIFYTTEKFGDALSQMGEHNKQCQDNPLVKEIDRLTVENHAQEQKIAELGAEKVQLENDACVARGEIEKLQVDKQANAREIHCIADLNHKLNKQIGLVTAENAKKADQIEKLEKYERFYMHIQAHLPEGLVVVCKICGKSLDEIEQALAPAAANPDETTTADDHEG